MPRDISILLRRPEFADDFGLSTMLLPHARMAERAMSILTSGKPLDAAATISIRCRSSPRHDAVGGLSPGFGGGPGWLAELQERRGMNVETRTPVRRFDDAMHRVAKRRHQMTEMTSDLRSPPSLRRTLAGWRQGWRGHAHSLGAGGGGAALRGSPRLVQGNEGSTSGASSLRPGPDLREGDLTCSRPGRSYSTSRSAWRPAAERSECAGAHIT